MRNKILGLVLIALAGASAVQVQAKEMAPQASGKYVMRPG